MKTETKIGACVLAFAAGVAGIVGSKLALFDVPLAQNATRALAGHVETKAIPADKTLDVKPLPVQTSGGHTLPVYVPAVK